MPENTCLLYGTSRGKQWYKCSSYGKVFIPKNLARIAKAQEDYILHKQNYFELSGALGLHRNTLQKYITWVPCVTGELPIFPLDTRFWVIIDTTYLRDRTDRFAIIRTNTEYNLNYAFVSLESLSSMGILLDQFTTSGYHLHTTSFTIDGRRLMFDLLSKRYPDIPIQMCLFHMKSIIRRYITETQDETMKSIDDTQIMSWSREWRDVSETLPASRISVCWLSSETQWKKEIRAQET